MTKERVKIKLVPSTKDAKNTQLQRRRSL